MITIIGAAGLGKSTLACMQLPTYLFNKLKEEDKLTDKSKFIIINTDYSLLLERYKTILNKFSTNYQDIRNYLDIQYVNSFYKQDELVKNLLKDSLENNNIEPVYICVDPFNHTLRQEFAKASEQMRLNVVGRLSPRLEYQLNLLTLIARKFNTVVVLTLLPKKAYTNVVPEKWQSGYFGPVEIAHLSDIVLWFSQGVHDPKSVTIHIKKHRLKESNQQFDCRITEGGVVLG